MSDLDSDGAPGVDGPSDWELGGGGGASPPVFARPPEEGPCPLCSGTGLRGYYLVTRACEVALVTVPAPGGGGETLTLLEAGRRLSGAALHPDTLEALIASGHLTPM